MTQALTDILETLDSALAKAVDDLEIYRSMLEDLGEDDIESYDEADDYIAQCEAIRGLINA